MGIPLYQAKAEFFRTLGHPARIRVLELLSDGDTVLTHCNAGGLATSELGTALAVIVKAHEQGKQIEVFADETRPLLQGARLTAWEMKQAGVPVTIICDSMYAPVSNSRSASMTFRVPSLVAPERSL